MCKYYAFKGVPNSNQGCSGAGTRGNAVPTPFSRSALKRVGSCLKMAIFGCNYHTFFVSTTYLIVSVMCKYLALKGAQPQL